MLPPVKKSIACCPLTSKSTTSLRNSVLSVHISLLIQMKQLFHWIEDLYFGQKQWFKVKNALVMNLFLKLYKTLIRLESCGLLVDYCDFFFQICSDIKNKQKKTCLHIGLEYYWWKELAHKTVWTGLLCTGCTVHFWLLKKKNSYESFVHESENTSCAVQCVFFSAAHEDN